VVDSAALQNLADAYFEKYAEDWKFTPNEGGFGEGDQFAMVYRVTPSKVLSFAKTRTDRPATPPREARWGA